MADNNNKMPNPKQTSLIETFTISSECLLCLYCGPADHACLLLSLWAWKINQCFCHTVQRERAVRWV